MEPKTIRYNNPGALIQRSPDKWIGLTGSVNGFLVFDSVHNGLRAAVINLRNTYFAKGLNTPAKIIPKYAPDSVLPNGDNNYIKFFSRYGIGPNTIIDRDNIVPFIQGLTHFEAGKKWIGEAEICKVLNQLGIDYNQTNTKWLDIVIIIGIITGLSLAL